MPDRVRRPPSHHGISVLIQQEMGHEIPDSKFVFVGGVGRGGSAGTCRMGQRVSTDLVRAFRKPVTTSQYYVAPVVVAQYAPPPVVVVQSSPCNTCEEKKCTTSYVQRSYYQPVTTYETKTVMEQVTTVQTSYYYAPVVSYRYSSYYDPSSCCAQQVAVPVTSYELRQKQCPVQSWVSRCVQVPVQGVQKVDYWQPQTTCCTTTQGAPIMGVAPPVQVQPAQPLPEGPPSITPSRTQGMSNGKPDMYNRYYYPPIENPAPEIRGSGSSFQPKLGIR